MNPSVCVLWEIRLCPEEMLRSQRVRQKLGNVIPDEFVNVWEYIMKRYSDLILLVADMSKKVDLYIIINEGMIPEDLDNVTPYIDDPPAVRTEKFRKAIIKAYKK